ncbi:glycyl-radical enzyme activating protein [Williamwhitmania taraxaci]|uniref:Glycerol dehydratase, cobalamin-independent, small subunit n=1 Tax=Williamwhitmania taraxaci TaxID=1640674 RepID=A0A1G6GX10_9BACT|nr:glycyl-radical enzyme activating protein [Williamwhitmania taraxaci]SDB85676.1 glycerol dehydratase, cobalamin-independent, small subunit [Williamwhitmania taraxaci]
MKEDTIISYFNISWLSEFDGPGKRIVVYLQGCQLDCAWCHSPQSQPSKSPLLFFNQFCIGCHRCESACKNNGHIFVNGGHFINRQHCTGCGSCVEACPNSSCNRNTGALQLPTKKVEVSSLFKMLKPQLELVKNSGGITFSGGEPLLQSGALAMLAKLCKDMGIHTAVETSGIVEIADADKLLPYVDTWLVGFRLHQGINKEPSPEMESITYKFLSHISKKEGIEIIGRIPVIPGYTNNDDYLTKVKELMDEFPVNRLELLPHNPESAHYYKAMGIKPIIPYNKELAESTYRYMKESLEIAILS